VSAPTRRCVLRHSRPHLEHAADAGRCRDFERRGALEAADVGARQSMLCILYDRYTVVVMEFNLTLSRQIQDKLGTLAPPNKFDTYPGRAAIPKVLPDISKGWLGLNSLIHQVVHSDARADLSSSQPTWRILSPNSNTKACAHVSWTE
jgi:hypothetical protein